MKNSIIIALLCLWVGVQAQNTAKVRDTEADFPIDLRTQSPENIRGDVQAIARSLLYSFSLGQLYDGVITFSSDWICTPEIRGIIKKTFLQNKSMYAQLYQTALPAFQKATGEMTPEQIAEYKEWIANATQYLAHFNLKRELAELERMEAENRSFARAKGRLAAFFFRRIAYDGISVKECQYWLGRIKKDFEAAIRTVSRLEDNYYIEYIFQDSFAIGCRYKDRDNKVLMSVKDKVYSLVNWGGKQPTSDVFKEIIAVGDYTLASTMDKKGECHLYIFDKGAAAPRAIAEGIRMNACTGDYERNSYLNEIRVFSRNVLESYTHYITTNAKGDWELVPRQDINRSLQLLRLGDGSQKLLYDFKYDMDNPAYGDNLPDIDANAVEAIYYAGDGWNILVMKSKQQVYCVRENPAMNTVLWNEYTWEERLKSVIPLGDGVGLEMESGQTELFLLNAESYGMVHVEFKDQVRRALAVRYEKTGEIGAGFYIVQEEQEGMSVFNQTGMQVFGGYDKIEKRWVDGSQERYYFLVEKDFEVSLLNDAGHRLSTPTSGQHHFIEVLDYDKGLLLVSKDEHYIARWRNNDRWRKPANVLGVQDFKGNMYLPVEYADVWKATDNLWFVAKADTDAPQGMAYGMYDAQFKQLTPPQFRAIPLLYDTLITFDPEAFEEIVHISQRLDTLHLSDGRAVMFLVTVRGEYGVFDLSGKHVVSAVWDSISLLHRKGLYLVDRGRQYGVVDGQNKTILTPQYQWIKEWELAGNINLVARNVGSGTGIFDQTGKVVFAPKPEYVDIATYADMPVFFVGKRYDDSTNIYAMYGAEGQRTDFIFKPQREYRTMYDPETFEPQTFLDKEGVSLQHFPPIQLAVLQQVNGLWGVYDFGGKAIIPADYVEIQPALVAADTDNHSFIVAKEENNQKVYALFNQKGERLTDFIYKDMFVAYTGILLAVLAHTDESVELDTATGKRKE